MAYLYRHIRHDKNQPFYVGIGDSPEYARAFDVYRRNPMWKRIAAKTTFDVEILFDDISIQLAKAKEVEFIKLYGRLNVGTGTLANITGGGDGYFDPPQEHRQRLINRNKGNQHHKGFRHTDDTKRKVGLHSSKRNSGRGNPAYQGEVEAFSDGVSVGIFESATVCAKELQVNRPSISSFFSGRRKSAGGYTFKRL